MQNIKLIEVSIFHEFMLYVIFYDWQRKYRFLMSYNHCKLYYNIFIYVILKNIFQAIYWTWISLLTCYYYTIHYLGTLLSMMQDIKRNPILRLRNLRFSPSADENLCLLKFLPFILSPICIFLLLTFFSLVLLKR